MNLIKSFEANSIIDIEKQINYWVERSLEGVPVNIKHVSHAVNHSEDSLYPYSALVVYAEHF